MFAESSPRCLISPALSGDLQTRRLLVVAHPKWNSPTSDPNAVAPTLKESESSLWRLLSCACDHVLTVFVSIALAGAVDKDFPEDAFSRLQSTAAADAIFDYSTTNPVVNYYVSHSCICLPLPVPTGGCWYACASCTLSLVLAVLLLAQLLNTAANTP